MCEITINDACQKEVLTQQRLKQVYETSNNLDEISQKEVLTQQRLKQHMIGAWHTKISVRKKF